MHPQTETDGGPHKRAVPWRIGIVVLLAVLVGLSLSSLVAYLTLG